MKAHWNRRKFIKATAAGSLGIALAQELQAFNIIKNYPAKDKYRVAIMGINGRGMDHVKAYLNHPKAEIAYICDVDQVPLAKAIEAASKGQVKPKSIGDFRKALDDKSVDILSIAAPDHWHAPAALLGLKAGKHIYIEKPGSHNPAEAEMLVEGMRKYNTKVVQMGNQRRSWPGVREAIKNLHDGVIGRLYYARAWYTNTRPSIGKGKIISVPPNLDYELWQGPAPRQPYKDNLLHYHWHWRWNWGTGEVVNNGVHFIDLARWGLQAEFPTKVYSTGGRYQYSDDWETPDTQIATFDFEGGKTIAWEGRSCNQRGINDMGSGVSFHGENGTLELYNNAYKIYDNKGKLMQSNNLSSDAKPDVVVTQTGPGFDLDKDHFANFFECLETGKTPNSIYSDCYKSVLLCHLANISYRTGRALHCDTGNGRIQNDAEAMKLWARDYEKGWQPSLT